MILNKIFFKLQRLWILNKKYFLRLKLDNYKKRFKVAQNNNFQKEQFSSFKFDPSIPNPLNSLNFYRIFPSLV